MRYPICPVAKPRMTRRDKWDKRPATEKYWKFKDLVKIHNVTLPEEGASITFYIPMPKSWSLSKRIKNDQERHQQKPDLDNLLKALCDAVYGDDSVVWQYCARKLWADEGGIEITTPAYVHLNG